MTRFLMALAGWEALMWAGRVVTRGRLFQAAQEAARRHGKPLLVVGCPVGATPGLSLFYHPCGDTTVDVADCPQCSNSVKADVSAMTQFADKQFGAAFVGYVLEYTDQPDLALEEIKRVADEVFVAHIQPLSLVGFVLPGLRHRILDAPPAGVLRFA